MKKIFFLAGILFASFPAFVLAATIDFAQDNGPATYRASGFLHSITSVDPPDSVILPVKSRLWRSTSRNIILNVYSRLVKFGAKRQAVISDDFRNNPLPGTGGDYSLWEKHVSDTVNMSKSRGQTIQWDVWNEPNSEFKGIESQYYETWRRAVLKIRSIDSNATIVGPSISDFNLAWMQSFLQYAKGKKVLPDILTWHELNGYPKGFKRSIDSIKSWMSQNGIDISRVQINEYLGSSSQFDLGSIVQYFAAFEEKKVEGVAHACWPDSGASNCSNWSLDGLLTNSTLKPRSYWWAYKAYADITGRLVKVTPSGGVDGVAGQDSSKGFAQAILGRVGSSGSHVVTFTNLSKVSGLGSRGKVHVLAQRIPNNNRSELSSPITTIDKDYSVSSDQVQVTLPCFGDNEAYIVKLGTGSGGGIYPTHTSYPTPSTGPTTCNLLDSSKSVPPVFQPETWLDPGCRLQFGYSSGDARLTGGL